MKLTGREDRRDRSWRYGNRARRVHLRVVHPDGVVDCLCEFSAWKFAKGKALSCGCRRSRFGRPKVSWGSCHGGGYSYHPSVRERIAGKRLCYRWVTWAGELDDFDGDAVVLNE